MIQVVYADDKSWLEESNSKYKEEVDKHKRLKVFHEGD